MQYAHRARMLASGVLPQVQHSLVWGWDLFIGLQLRNQTRLASQWTRGLSVSSSPALVLKAQLLACVLVTSLFLGITLWPKQTIYIKKKCLTWLWFQRVRVYNGGVKVWRQGAEDSRLTLQGGGTHTHTGNDTSLLKPALVTTSPKRTPPYCS